jgi:hypothetical protein
MPPGSLTMTTDRHPADTSAGGQLGSRPPVPEHSPAGRALLVHFSGTVVSVTVHTGANNLNRAPGRALICTLALVLTGCGTAGAGSPMAVPGTPPPPPVSSTSPGTVPSSASVRVHPGPATPVPGASSTRPAGGWTASGSSLGVDRASWPETFRGAQEVLTRLPDRLNGVARETYANAGDDEDPPHDAGASYGDRTSVTVFEAYRSNDPLDPHHAWGSATNVLAAAFGLGLACAKGSYRGTAPRPRYPGAGPGSTERAVTKPVWFSCRVAGAEGDDDYRAHAVGWTSGKTAWLVVTPNQRTTAGLVGALHEGLR